MWLKKSPSSKLVDYRTLRPWAVYGMTYTVRAALIICKTVFRELRTIKFRKRLIQLFESWAAQSRATSLEEWVSNKKNFKIVKDLPSHNFDNRLKIKSPLDFLFSKAQNARPKRVLSCNVVQPTKWQLDSMHAVHYAGMRAGRQLDWKS